MKKKIIIVCSAIVFIIFCLLLRVTLKKTNIDGETTVEVVSVTKGIVSEVYQTDGVVESYVLCSKNASFSGNVNDVLAEEGQKVSLGDIIINFDNSNEIAALKMSEYEYTLACDNYKNAVLINLNSSNEGQQLNNDKSEIKTFIVAKQAEHSQIQGAYIQNKEILASKKKELIDLQSQIEDCSVSGNDAIDINTIEERISQINKEIIDIELSMESQSITMNNLVNELSLKQSELSIVDNNIYTNEQTSYSEYELDALNIQKMIALIQKERCDAALTLLNGGVLAEQEGIITNIGVETDSVIVRGQHLFDIVAEKKRKAVLYLPCEKLKDINLNNKVVVTYLDKEYTGKIEKIDNKAEMLSTGENAVKVEVLLDNGEDVLIEGINVDVEIVMSLIYDAYSVPVTAVKSDKKGDFVYVVKDRIIEKRYVSTGIIYDNYVEIVDGLQDVEVVVNSYDKAIADGDMVSIAEE